MITAILRLHAAFTVLGLATLALALSDAPAWASPADTLRLAPNATRPPIVPLGGADEDRVRLDQLRGVADPDGFLLRSSSTLGAPPEREDGIHWIVPRLRGAYNSDIPRSMNEGALWAGRGSGFLLSGGGAARWGPARVVVAPEFTLHQNRPFEYLEAVQVHGRTRYSLPWHVGTQSIDLPARFGPDVLRTVTLGGSAVTVEAGPLIVGVSNEAHWWGPGARNAIVLGANAPGFLHALARTARPLRVSGGHLEFAWLAGTLQQSPYFLGLPEESARALSGAAVAFTPAAETGLTIGAARVVYSDTGDPNRIRSRALDALLRWGDISDDGAEDPARQLVSFFGRWILPAAGAEIYGEWGWVEAPTLRQLLRTPHTGQGYTLGIQWTRPFAERVDLRLHGEVTNLEQDGTWRHDSPPTFYAGLPVLAGYTHRGESLGAAIGPGASSQWAAVDAIVGNWVGGLYVERVRWNNDAYYTRPEGLFYFAHDVSLTVGARAHGITQWGTVSAEFGREVRHNFHFQNPSYFFDPWQAVDVTNWIFRLEVRPAANLLPITPLPALP